MNKFKCIDQCRSPVACGGWGYCRERHFLPEDDPDFRDPRTPRTNRAMDEIKRQSAANYQSN